MEPVKIKVGPVLKEINPEMVIGIIESRVTNSEYNKELWIKIRESTERIRKTLSFDDIKNQYGIAATRKMYSACGKDPSRYRPSAEALMRRIVKGQDLYQINTLVDIINLISLNTGYSIGGFDASLIEGPVEAGVGKNDETFHAIGRGLLNIESLPVLRDTKGPIGSPTSDEERTAIRNSTNHLLMTVYAFGGSDGLPSAMEYAVDLLKQHAGAIIVNRDII